MSLTLIHHYSIIPKEIAILTIQKFMNEISTMWCLMVPTIKEEEDFFSFAVMSHALGTICHSIKPLQIEDSLKTAIISKKDPSPAEIKPHVE